MKDLAAGALPADLAADLSHRTWSRSHDGESGGAMYRLSGGGEDLYLKHGTGRVADEIADEFARLRWLAGRLPVPRVRHFVADGDAAWLLTTALAGRTGEQWIARDQARLPAIVVALARFLRTVHALPIDGCPFEAGAAVRLAAARLNVTEGRVDTDDFDDDHRGWTAEAVLAEAERLRPPCERCVTHGDYSLVNVLIDEAGAVTGCIDVGRLGVADPYQDIAILWQHLGEHGGAMQRLFLDSYGIGQVDERRLAFHRCLDELF